MPRQDIQTVKNSLSLPSHCTLTCHGWPFKETIEARVGAASNRYSATHIPLMSPRIENLLRCRQIPQSLARQIKGPRSLQSRRFPSRPPRMLQLPLRLPIFPLLRRDPPSLPTDQRPITDIPRSFFTRERITNIPARRKYPRICSLHQEIPQYLPTLLARRNPPSNPSKSPPLRYRHPRQNHF